MTDRAQRTSPDELDKCHARLKALQFACESFKFLKADESSTEAIVERAKSFADFILGETSG